MTLTKFALVRARTLALILLPTMLHMPISHAGEAIGQAGLDQISIDQTAIQQAIRLYNQSKIKQAKAVFQAEADKGSATATYWLGITQYESGERFEAGDSFYKAANMGDPWAMDLLVPGGNSPCDYLGWPCDESWHEKAMAGWAKLADKGDGKAKYAMYVKGDKWWQYIPFYRQKVRNENYEDIMQHKGYGILNRGVFWDTTEQRVNYLKMAAEDGYAPAMFMLFFRADMIGRDKANEWIFKALELGYYKAANTLSYLYETGSDGYPEDFIQSYYYYRLTIALGGNISGSPRVVKLLKNEWGGGLKGEDGKSVYKILVTPEQQAAMDKKVEEFIQRVKPNRFLDETTTKLFFY
ncbi:sel1 repeat family protein [Photobacterium nomapromontoriensis]|uniref:sel1 repeat family protein n=1 Tax=Photobacterium nomapromontoriensis TaxID=2910237 RepID=UPI003D125B30